MGVGVERSDLADLTLTLTLNLTLTLTLTWPTTGHSVAFTSRRRPTIGG